MLLISGDEIIMSSTNKHIAIFLKLHQEVFSPQLVFLCCLLRSFRYSILIIIIMHTQMLDLVIEL